MTPRQEFDGIGADGLGVVALPDPIRIAGDEGMALVMTQVPVYESMLQFADEHVGFDIGLIDPDRYLCFRNRQVQLFELNDLACFFHEAMVAQGQSQYASISGGFALSVLPTDDGEGVFVQVDVNPKAGQVSQSAEQFVFLTTRAACWGAAQAARRNADAAKNSVGRSLPPFVDGGAS